MLVPFRNEPLTDFSQPAARAAFQAALEQTAARFDDEALLVIGGEPVSSGEWIVSYGSRANGTGPWAAWRGARRPWRSGRSTRPGRRIRTGRGSAPEARARVLWRAAALLRERKHDFSAMMVYEVGEDLGRGRRATPPRRSTSWSSTAARCCAWPGRRR